MLSGYLYKKKITIDSSKIDSTLTDFPILVSLSDPGSYSEDITAEGTPSASSEFNATHSASKAIDNNTSTQWAVTEPLSLPTWWKLDFGADNFKIIEKYTMQARTDAYWEQIPTAWLFQGSNNDSSWTTLDTQSGLSWTQSEKKEFTFSNDKAYRYYRLYITASLNGVNTSFCELEMMESGNFNFSHAQSDGADIRFTKPDDTLLKYERVIHDDVNKIAHYWVKIPSISSSTDTEFFIQYGNATASDGEDATNVWDSNFLAVMHLKDITTSTVKNSVDGTSKNKYSANNPLESTGEIYKAQDFSSDHIILGDIDIDGNGTIEALVNPSSFGSTYGNSICSKGTGLNSGYADLGLFLSETNGYVYIQSGDISTSQAFISTLQTSTGTWQYVAGRADGTNLSAFLGTTKDTTAQTTTPAGNYTNYTIGRFGSSSALRFSGKMEEVRISDTDRSDAWLKATKETCFDSLVTYGTEIQPEVATISETITLDDNWGISTNPDILDIFETLALDDEWQILPNPTVIDFSETLTLDDSWDINLQVNYEYVSQIISYNPLIAVTNTNPSILIHIDISTPTVPVKTSYILTGLKYAKGVVYNSSNEYFYVIGSEGKVAKVEEANLNNITIIDTGSNDAFLSVDALDAFFKTYISTDNSLGEIVLLDESEIININTDIRWIQQINSLISTQINTILGKTISTDFRFKEENDVKIKTDLRWVAIGGYEAVTQNPIDYSDIQVKINGTNLISYSDVDIQSIIITHDITQTANKASTASFVLHRRHDRLNEDNQGNSSEITNNNEVQIIINGNTEFSGKISNLNASSQNESVIVNALGARPEPSKTSVIIPLSGVNESIHPYHCMVNSIQIDNPFIDTDDEVPEYYKGVKVNLGTEIVQNILRYSSFGDITALAEKAENGTLTTKQNWTYFWLAKAENFLTGSEWFNLRYIGTSLSSMTADTWAITGLAYKYQKQLDDTENDLGFYYLGSEPYYEVAVKNGRKIAKDKWENKIDGLYRVLDAQYDYEQYAKDVAELEYEQLKNINGDILPITSATIGLTLDAYYYYGIKLLTRVNLNNTTTANIYNGNNGFPVAVWTIQINTADMSVTLNCNNQQSQVELEEIVARYPDEESDEYLIEGESVKVYSKWDANNWSYPS